MTTTSGDAVPQAKVVSQLMQNHRLATPVTGDSLLSVSTDGTGELQLFSIGSSGHVFQTYQDENSDSGWSLRDLQYPGVAAFVGCVTNLDNSITVVAADGKTGVDLLQLPATFNPTLPSWIQLPAINVRGIRTGNAPDGSAVICIYNGTDCNFYMLGQSNGSYSWGTGLQSVTPIIPTIGWKYSQVYDTDDCSGPFPGVVWTGTKITGGQTGLLSRGWAFQGGGYGCEAAGNYTIVSAIADVKGDWDTFALKSDDLGIYYLEAPVGGNSSEYLVTKVSQDTACTTVAAGRVTPTQSDGGPAFLLQAFGISTSGFLYVTQQDPTSQTGWDDFIALSEDIAFAQVCAGVNGDGNSELFAVATDGTLYHIWEDPATTDWNFDEIEVATAGQLEDVPTYQTVISATDASGLPMPYAAVTLSCPHKDAVELQINGEEVLVGPNSPWNGTTNSLGKIVINQATSGLGSPVLQLSVNGITNIPLIDASGTIQGTLSNVTGQTLIDANLIAPQYQEDADSVAQGVQQALGMVPTTQVTSLYVHAQSDFRAFAANGGRIDPVSVRDRHWSYEVRSGRPQFRVLQPDETAALIAEMKTLPRLDASLLGSLNDAWGDVVSAVKRGVATVVTWAVSGAKVTLRVVIQGVQYFYDTILNLIEEALDLAEQILSTVQILFAQLFEWLGYIFNWQNILRTQEAMVHAVNEVLQFFQDAAGTIKTNIDKNLVSFVNNQLSGFFTTVEQSLGTTTNFGQYQISNAKPPQGFDSPAAQLMSTHLLQNADNATPVSALAAANLASASSSLQNVLDKVQDLTTTYGVSDKVQNALAFFQSAANSQDQYLQLVLSGMLAVVEAAILAVMAGVQLVVDAVLDAIADIISAIQAVFNQEWNIPIISDLYQRMTVSNANPNGASLTGLSLLGLIVAVPATVVYSVVNSVAPFPDDDSLAAFENGFTSAMLLQNSGLGGSSQSASRALAVAPGDGSNTWPVIFAYLQAGALGVTAIVEPILDIQIPENFDTSQLSSFSPKQPSANAFNILALSVLLLEVCNVGLSVPWVGGPKSWSSSKPEGWQCYGWCKDAMKLGVDMSFFVLQKALPRQLGDPGVWFEFFAAWLEVPTAVGYLATGGNGWSGAAGLIAGFGDMLRICRLEEIIAESFGVSLAVLLSADVVGNLAEAGLTIAGAGTPSSSNV
ncbi:MAG: hypothetical protein WAN65_14075 [Candidatus Sulfotelmatobacter sp.]